MMPAREDRGPRRKLTTRERQAMKLLHAPLEPLVENLPCEGCGETRTSTDLVATETPGQQMRLCGDCQ